MNNLPFYILAPVIAALAILLVRRALWGCKRPY